MRWVSFLPAAALLLFALGGPARATVVLPLALSDLVDRSDVVARVRVVSTRIVQTPEAPFRATELEVVEGFAGAQPGETFEIWQRGDGYVFVIGDPWLEPGQEGLVFLRHVDGRFYLTALAQSWWNIEGQGDELIAQRDLSGLEILHRDVTVMVPPNQISWSSLRQMVLQACRRGR